MPVLEEPRAHWLYRAAMGAIRPPTPVDCLTWNRTHGRLSARDSARPGAWSDEMTPYVGHWLNIASARKLGRGFMGDRDPYAHLTEQIWVVKGTQVGLTRSLLLAILGWLIDQQPGPTGYFLPRKEDLGETQRERLMPFFEESPQLAKHLPPLGTDARKMRITEKRWHLDTATVYFLSSSIASELRSRPLCDEAWDEFDLAPKDVDGQGDAIELGLDRQKTFGRRRLAFGVTTPTWIDAPGWRRLISGSHERVLVDCLECGATQELAWDQLRVLEDERDDHAHTLAEAVKAGLEPQRIKVSDAEGRPGLARWACAHCGRLHGAGERDRIVADACRRNRWIPGKWVLNEEHPHGLWTPWADFDDGHRLREHARCETTIRTGHLHSLYSPFVTLCEAAAREMSCIQAGSDEEWVAHRNNWRAEPTLPTASADAPSPKKLLEVIAHQHPRFTAPADAQKILITCDQQGNERTTVWFPYVVRGWGPAGESWLIDCGQVAGWDELEQLERKVWTIGTDRRAADAIALDAANGNMRVDIQSWAQARANIRLLLHGRERLSSPIQQRFARDPRKATHGRKILAGIRYFYTDPNAWKTMLADRLKASPGLPGWHLCADVPDAYLASLGSEHQVRVIDRDGRPKMRWMPRTIITPTGREEERKDTHWLDCEQMQLAAAHVLKFDQLKPVEVIAVTTTPTAGGFMDGYNL
jgi:phage terminase large subunit GpA-like protein